MINVSRNVLTIRPEVLLVYAGSNNTGLNLLLI